MKLFNKIALTLLIVNSISSQASDLLVVANTDATEFKVKKRQVRDIFMGNNSEFELKPVALTPSSSARYIFNTKIVGLTESRIQSYWAQMRFSGRQKPPQEFESVEAMLAFVLSHKNTVAYLPSDTKVPDGLTVIYQTD